MIAIAAVDENWAIGKDNQLLFSIPDDMKFFRETTSGHTVVMGRKTLESFPGGRPLKNRTNIVLTRDETYGAEGAVIVHSIEELMDRIKDIPGDTIFVIGGASVYQMLVPFCSKCYITKMYKEFPADAFFPDLDADCRWTIAERGGLRKYEVPEQEAPEHEVLEYDAPEQNALVYEFLTYVKADPEQTGSVPREVKV